MEDQPHPLVVSWETKPKRQKNRNPGLPEFTNKKFQQKGRRTQKTQEERKVGKIKSTPLDPTGECRTLRKKKAQAILRRIGNGFAVVINTHENKGIKDLPVVSNPVKVGRERRTTGEG